MLSRVDVAGIYTVGQGIGYLSSRSNILSKRVQVIYSALMARRNTQLAMGAAYDAASALEKCGRGITARLHRECMYLQCCYARLGRSHCPRSNQLVRALRGVHLSLLIPFCNFAFGNPAFTYFSHLPARLLCSPSLYPQSLHAQLLFSAPFVIPKRWPRLCCGASEAAKRSDV